MQRAALLQALQAAKFAQTGSRPPRGLQLLYSGISSSPEGSVADKLLGPRTPGQAGCLVSFSTFSSAPRDPRSQGAQTIEVFSLK